MAGLIYFSSQTRVEEFQLIDEYTSDAHAIITLHTVQNGQRDTIFVVLSSLTALALFPRRSKDMIIWFCIFIKMGSITILSE